MTDQQILKPCPFCGSKNIDPEGWASTERKGPACDDCGSSADTVTEWNTRPLEDDMLAALKRVVAVADRKTDEFDAARAAIAKAEASNVGALPHKETGATT